MLAELSTASGQPPASLSSIPSRGGLTVAEGAVEAREELHNLGMSPGLISPLRAGGAKTKAVHLWDCEMEEGALALRCTLARV